HATLRASFHWRDLEKPVQVVHARVAVEIDRHDWRRLRADDVEARLAALMADDRARGFDVAAAPLMRWSLLRSGERTHRFVWSYHHLLLDGWSLQLVLADVFARYDAARGGRPRLASHGAPYSRYAAWLQAQDTRAAEAFWRHALAGVDRPTPLGMSHGSVAVAATAEAMDEEAWRLPREATAAVVARAREWKVTPNALVLAAWALLLARYAESRDVIVGAVCSGRPAELEGVETMVGAFANTLPLRVPVDPEAQVRPWLAEVQRRQLRALQHQWSSLVDIQGWSDVPRGTPLFENLFVFQNAPAAATAHRFGGVTLGDVRFRERTNLPLTLEAWLGDELTVTLFYDRRRFTRDVIENVLAQLATVIDAMSQDPATRLRDLTLINRETRRRVLADWNATGPGRWEGPCVPESFAAQAARTPDATAVSD